VQQASGDIVGILHSDDIFGDEYVISSVVKEFCDRNVNIVYGNIVHVKRCDIQTVVRYWDPGKFSKKKFNLGWLPPHNACFYSAEIAKRFSYNPSLKVAGDTIFLYDLLKSEGIRVSYLPRLIVRQRTGGVSTSGISSIIASNIECFHHLRVPKPRRLIFIVSKLARKMLQVARGFS
jgi:glycosyltransferase